MTPDNVLVPARTRGAAQKESAQKESSSGSRRPATRGPRRRAASAVIAGLAVVGFSVAIVAPAGYAMSGSVPAAAATTTTTNYAQATQDAQNITVSVNGAKPTVATRDTFEVYVKPPPPPPPPPAPEPASADSSSSGGSGGGSLFYSGGGAPAQWMAAAGIASSDWGYVDYIVSQESGWNPNATNSGSGACGLVQALPCSKVPGNGYDPVDNLRWANGYAVGRYGSWAGAKAFWSANNWW